MIKVIVCGGYGKMGSKIAQLVSQDKEMKLIGVIERKNHPVFEQKDLFMSKLMEGVPLTYDLESVLDKKEPSMMLDETNLETDVIITFTTPEASLGHLEIAAKYKKAVIIGTTGLKEEYIARVKELSKEIPCVMAPNMSQGVNLLFKLVREVAKALPGYDIEIIEAHHNQKKDAPSGTALRLATEAGLGRLSTTPDKITDQIFSHGRQGIIGPRKPEEIGVHAVRAGDIVGEHTVIFAGPGERIELNHRAHSRDVFAHGAIKAAKWIVGKPAGLYDMQDVLGIK